MEEMLHHSRAVARGAKSALLVGDMPFMSFQASADEAIRNAGRFLKEGGMHAVKLEGPLLELAETMTARGIPVMGHLGLTPQSVHTMGGYRVQARSEEGADRLLSDALRHDLGLTGTHVGCEHGVCGACTVLVDGAPVRACLMFAVSAVDAEITTVEGLARTDGSLSPVQQAFRECHGLQCGFCTPGFLTTITAGLAENPHPTEEEAREMVSGNLCRCTGYQNIVKAVQKAAAEL
jgi:carbon-monoxide dehydrogenase small subunit